jgi:hypothetical protein
MATRLHIGDVFEVFLSEKRKGYFQYITTDHPPMELGGYVIRAFQKKYDIKEEPSLEEVVRGPIDFIAHVPITVGIKFGLWKRVGQVKDVGDVENIQFKVPNDLEYTPETISDNWRVWKINQLTVNVGKLVGENRHAHAGSIFSPSTIVERMDKGKDAFSEPRFE